MTAIIDYGVGNLFSLRSSLNAIGEESTITGDDHELLKADRVILPGVGAFGDAADKLSENGLSETVKNIAASGKPLLGICLGMQLLFDRSFEFGEHEGLGLIPGEIRPIAERIAPELKIPHIGWNALHFTGSTSPLFRELNEGDHVYFVHSFAAEKCEAFVTATTSYGVDLTAAVQKENIYGCQFHPEKSGPVGLRILKAFISL